MRLLFLHQPWLFFCKTNIWPYGLDQREVEIQL